MRRLSIRRATDSRSATRSGIPHQARLVRVLVTPLSAVVVLLAGLGFLLAPATPAAAQPPAQGWTTTEAPLPTDSGNGSTNPEVYTAGSSCPAVNACVMAGWYLDTNGKAWGLIENQNGTNWTETEAPQPNNAGSGAKQDLRIGAANCGEQIPCRPVSCPTVTFCVAVGQFNDDGGSSGYTEPLIETFSNGSWAAIQSPLPGDAASDSGPTYFPSAWLFSVSCATPTSCAAVGEYQNTSGDRIGYLATLSGTTWIAQPVPLPSGAQFSDLEGVSCPSAGSCTAVGGYEDASGYANGLIDVLANGTWTSTRAPEPSNSGNDTDSDQYAELFEVSCWGSSCAAVGGYEDSSGNDNGLIDFWNGASWTATEAPLPPSAISPEFVQLLSVSCGSATTCTAVGSFEQGGGGSFLVIDTLSDGTWTAPVPPLPGNASPASNAATRAEDVSCPTAAYCVAVGGYNTATSGVADHGFVDTLSAGSWSTTEIPVPSNVQLANSLYSYARTVTCYSPVACVVGGFYSDTNGNEQGALDTWTGAQGYWLDATDGGIFTYPNNTFYGSTGALKLNKPMVGMAPTPDGQGYWLVASDGGIFSYGDAQFHGSRGGQPLNKPIVGMATTPDGQGYWLVASDGGIFTYGDANYYGSRGGQPINAPIVGMAATPDGGGYWLVGSDGGIYSYGDALFYGSTGALKLNKPVVGMAASPSGLGYWLVASDGGVFNYGAANFYGSTGSLKLNKPVVGMASSPSGLGYWLVASDGGIFNYGDAPFEGSAGSLHLNAPVVGMAGG